MRYVLHIGYGKTGSTALQSCLARNRRRLSERGVLYPDIRYRRLGTAAENHNIVAAALAGVPTPPWASPADFFADFERQAKGRDGISTIVISAEGFSGFPNVLLFETEQSFRDAEIAYIRRLRDALGDHEATIVAYLRRQDLWLASMANQRVKFEGRNAGPPFVSMEQFAGAMWPRLDYFASLTNWAEAFGRENLIVRPYERAALRAGDVIDDFLGHLGLGDLAAQLDRPEGSASENTSLNAEVFAFKVNHPVRSESSADIELTGRFLRRLSADMGGEGAAALPPDLAGRIMETFGPSNRRIAAELMTPPAPELFADARVARADAKSSEFTLSPQAEAEIASALARYRASPAGRALWLRLRLAEALGHHAPRLKVILKHLISRVTRAG